MAKFHVYAKPRNRTPIFIGSIEADSSDDAAEWGRNHLSNPNTTISTREYVDLIEEEYPQNTTPG